MMDAILSVTDFLSRFQVGSVFWYMKRYQGQAPSAIEGPCRVVAISTTYQGREVGTPIVTFTHQPNYGISGSGEETKTMFIADITETSRGAFASEEDACTYLQERRFAYETDPILIAKLQKERDDNERISDYEARETPLWPHPEVMVFSKPRRAEIDAIEQLLQESNTVPKEE